LERYAPNSTIWSRSCGYVHKRSLTVKRVLVHSHVTKLTLLSVRSSNQGKAKWPRSKTTSVPAYRSGIEEFAVFNRQTTSLVRKRLRMANSGLVTKSAGGEDGFMVWLSNQMVHTTLKFQCMGLVSFGFPIS